MYGRVSSVMPRSLEKRLSTRPTGPSKNVMGALSTLKNMSSCRVLEDPKPALIYKMIHFFGKKI